MTLILALRKYVLTNISIKTDAIIKNDGTVKKPKLGVIAKNNNKRISGFMYIIKVILSWFPQLFLSKIF